MSGTLELLAVDVDWGDGVCWRRIGGQTVKQQSDGEQVIAYLEKRRKAEEQRKGVFGLLALCWMAVVVLSVWLAPFTTALAWSAGAFVVASIIAIIYGVRHR